MHYHKNNASIALLLQSLELSRVSHLPATEVDRGVPRVCDIRFGDGKANSDDFSTMYNFCRNAHSLVYPQLAFLLILLSPARIKKACTEFKFCSLALRLVVG